MPTPSYTVASGSVLEFRLVGALFGQRVLNVWHYRVAPDSPVTPGLTVINALHAFFDVSDNTESFVAQLRATLSQDLTFLRGEYQWIHTTRYAAERRDWENLPTAFLGPTPTSNIAASITLGGELALAGRMGRKQIAGIPTTDVSEGIISLDVYNQLVEAADLMKDDIAAGGVTLQPVILRKTAPALSLPITRAFVQSTARDQRTRTVGQGI